MSYSLYDYTESLNCASVSSQDVKRVVAGWGEPGDGGEWEGGFLMEMKDGRFAYVEGWCDYTGWGCQDGASVEFFKRQPDRLTLSQKAKDWDDEPADLNRWHAHGCPDRYNYEDFSN